MTNELFRAAHCRIMLTQNARVFFRAACAIDGKIAVEACFLRDTDHAAIHFAEDRAVMLAQVWNEVEYLAGFPLD